MVVAPNPILILILVIGGLELWAGGASAAPTRGASTTGSARWQRVAVGVTYLGLAALLVLAMEATHIERDL